MTASAVARAASAQWPTRFGDFRAGYRSLPDGDEQLALTLGDPRSEGALTCIHVPCRWGHAFGSRGVRDGGAR
jgi:GTP cyclohydrolase II